ncbi:MAG: acyl carrier protein [Pseudomonadota bacterium]
MSHPKLSGDLPARVTKLIAEQLCKEVAEVTVDKTFQQLDSDSLDQIEIVMALEDEFEIVIEEVDADKITSVQTAIDYVQGVKAAL